MRLAAKMRSASAHVRARIAYRKLEKSEAFRERREAAARGECGKRVFPTEDLAETALVNCARDGRPECASYFCVSCDGWHLTSSRR